MRSPHTLATCTLLLALASTAAAQEPPRVRTLAVLPAESVGDVDLSEQATGEIRRSFAEVGKFALVEQERIADVMKQIALGQTRDFDAARAVEVGRLVSAHYVCFTSVTNPSVSRTPVDKHTLLRAYVTISLRLVSVRTGEVLFEDSHTDTHQGWENTTTDLALLGSAARLAAQELVERLDRKVLTEGLVIAIRGKDEILIDLGTAIGVRKGQRFLVTRPGALVSRPDGSTVRSPAEKIGEVELTRVGDESAIAKRVRGSMPAIGDRVVEKARKKSVVDW